MTNISLRLYGILCLMLTYLSAFAQDNDDMPDDHSKTTGIDELSGFDDVVTYQPLHISFTDVMTVVAIVAACYVFGKIWKGCVYLIIVLAILFYFMLH